MNMFVQFLLFTCACALGVADEVPPYGEIHDNLEKAYYILQENVLSMDGNIPLVNDPRRHYAEIINVVLAEAASLVRGGVPYPSNPEYYKDYQRNINIAAPFALVEPQLVINVVKWTIAEVREELDKVSKLIQKAKEVDDVNINIFVDEAINKDIEKYGPSKVVYIAAGLVATQLNEAHEKYFAESSQNLSAHNFVITGVERLEKLVRALTNLLSLVTKC